MDAPRGTGDSWRWLVAVYSEVGNTITWRPDIVLQQQQRRRPHTASAWVADESTLVRRRVVLSGTLNLREWTLREWTIRHDVAGVENAGVDNEAPCGKGGQCGSGQCMSGEMRVKMCNIVMTGKETMLTSLSRLTVDNMQGWLCC